MAREHLNKRQHPLPAHGVVHQVHNGMEDCGAASVLVHGRIIGHASVSENRSASSRPRDAL
eukprot:4215753-Pyramimonas_sp.AAC.1